MTPTIFWRLAWKEYRQQRDLLVAIGLITLALLAIALGWSWVEGGELSTDTAYHLALMMPVFYVLGCAAILFAGEHERDTFAFLRALPLRSRDAFWPKAMIAVTSTLVLTIALVLLAAIFTSFRPLKTPAELGLLVHYLLIMAEVLVWTMLFSQLLKHPFWAIAVGGVAYFASFLVIALVGSLTHRAVIDQQGDFNYGLLFIAVRCAIALLLAVVNVVLGTRWLERERIFTPSLAGPTVEEVVVAKGPATRWMMLGRLWWQSLRESGWIFASIYGALVLLSVLIAIEQGPVLLVWGCLPVLVASFTFFQDHWKEQYRFFAVHGVPPRTLWWARILASMTVCLPWFVVLVIAIATMKPEVTSGYERFRTFQWPTDLLVLAVICFAWGQWCSLVFRSSMVGLFVGVAMSLGLPFSLAILRALGIPDWLGIYIPAIVLLWASWYRAPDWLAERNSWRRWFAYAATLAVPLLLILGGIAAHRAYEIPQLVDNSSFVSGPGGVNIPAGIAAQHPAAMAELQRPATTEELETARLYRELWTELRHLPPPNTGGAMMMGSMPPGDSSSSGPSGAAEAGSSAISPGSEVAPVDKEWEAKLAKLVERFVEISQRPDADFFPVPFSRTAQVAESGFESVFERAAIVDARRLDDVQEHDQAVERYLALIRFARHYQQRGDSQHIYIVAQSLGRVYEQLLSRAVRIKQSQESLLALLKKLNAAPYDFAPDYELAWMREYAWQRGLVEFNPSAWEVVATRPEAATQQRLLAWLPWERARAARWVDYWSVVSQLDHRARVHAYDWQGNTVGALVIGVGQDPRESLDSLLKKQRAALEVRLLLLAYKAKHGELPPSLNDLEREFPGQMQANPTTQQAWVYRPQGDPAEQELHRPFISPPRVQNPEIFPYPSSAHRDFERYGEVFWIEPGTTDE